MSKYLRKWFILSGLLEGSKNNGDNFAPEFICEWVPFYKDYTYVYFP